MAIQDIPAPMTGTVLEILVNVGDRVNEGEELVIIESMKMEIPVERPTTGIVAAVVATVAAPIEEGALLLRLEV